MSPAGSEYLLLCRFVLIMYIIVGHERTLCEALPCVTRTSDQYKLNTTYPSLECASWKVFQPPLVGCHPNQDFLLWKTTKEKGEFMSIAQSWRNWRGRVLSHVHHAPNASWSRFPISPICVGIVPVRSFAPSRNNTKQKLWDKKNDDT